MPLPLLSRKAEAPSLQANILETPALSARELPEKETNDKRDEASHGEDRLADEYVKTVYMGDEEEEVVVVNTLDNDGDGGGGGETLIAEQEQGEDVEQRESQTIGKEKAEWQQ